MFGGNKISGARAAAGTLDKPAIQGGAAMMLRSMGIDPAQMEAVAEGFLTDVAAMRDRVEKIEQRLGRIEELLTKIASE